MQIVQKFKTKDGQMFDDRVSARKHEIELETLEKLKTLLKTSIQTGRIDSVMKDIVFQHADIIKVLISFRQKQPKGVATTA